jgi:hypothetical protein
MVDQHEQARRYESAKRAAKAKAEADEARRHAITEKLRAIRRAREASGGGSAPGK